MSELEGASVQKQKKAGHRIKGFRQTEGYDRDSILFIADAVIINAAYTLTTGSVLSGYAYLLGGNDFITAILNNSTNFSTVLCLFSFIIFERLKKRKNLLLIMNLLSRAMMFGILFLPGMDTTGSTKLAMLAAMVIIADIIWGIYRVGWIVWMMNILPPGSKTKYIYFRMLTLRIGVSLATIASGLVLDHYGKGYAGFAVIFTASFIMSVVDVVILSFVREDRYITDEAAKPSTFRELMFQPAANGEYRNFLVFMLFFYLFETMASSFTPIYMIKYLKFDYRFITAVNAYTIIIMIIANRVWQKVEIRKGYNAVLGATAFIIASEMLVLSFLTKNTWYIVFLSATLRGIGFGGFNVSIFTYRYAIMPPSGKTLFEGWFYFMSGLGMLAAPFAGSAVLKFVTAMGLTSGSTGINGAGGVAGAAGGIGIAGDGGYRFLYLFSFILLLLLSAGNLRRIRTGKQAA